MLQAGEHDDSYWINFYKSLRFSIQKVLFNSNENRPYQRKKLQDKSINAIARQWDYQALACLIALLRDKNFKYSFPVYDNTEIAVYHLLLHTCCRHCFLRFVDEIWSYLKEHVIRQQRDFMFHGDLWEDDLNTTQNYIGAVNANICLAEDLGLIFPGKLTREFMFWKRKGDTKLIIEEMHEAWDVEQYQLKDSYHGLKWLISKLNQSRPKSKQLGEII